jgi:hypothetical protein
MALLENNKIHELSSEDVLLLKNLLKSDIELYRKFQPEIVADWSL